MELFLVVVIVSEKRCVISATIICAHARYFLNLLPILWFKLVWIDKCVIKGRGLEFKEIKQVCFSDIFFFQMTSSLYLRENLNIILIIFIFLCVLWIFFVLLKFLVGDVAKKWFVFFIFILIFLRFQLKIRNTIKYYYCWEEFIVSCCTR